MNSSRARLSCRKVTTPNPIVVTARIAVKTVSHQPVRVRRDDCERANPLPRGGLLPVLPQSCDAEGTAILHGDRERLLRLLPLDRLPLEEAVHRNNAAMLTIGIPERRQIAHGLALGI